MNKLSPHMKRKSQSGAALVIGLLLLLVLTLLAVSGMNTATLDLQMAGNEQSYQGAFQAAETGIEQALVAPSNDTSVVATIAPTAVSGSNTDNYKTTTKFNCATGIFMAEGNSTGEGGGGQSISRYYFDTQATGDSTRNAASTHTQSFYVVGPTTTCK
jgi:type IV pilus assembly protein PilX